MDPNDVVQLSVRSAIASVKLCKKPIGIVVRHIGDVSHGVRHELVESTATQEDVHFDHMQAIGHPIE